MKQRSSRGSGSAVVVLLLGVLFASFLSACTTAPTSVLVVVDTDARLRVLSMRALVSRGSTMSVHPEMQAWTRSGSTQDFTFPASFGVTPGTTANDGVVTVQVEMTFTPTSTGQPIVTVRRTARFRFSPHAPSVIRLFLPASCAAEVLSPSHCADTSAPCTISRFCEEQTPSLTCGDDGRCGAVDVTPTPLLSDAGDVTHDGTVDHADVPATDTSVPRDGFDVSEACVPACTGRLCGSDGCTGSCGTCPSGQSCDATGRCACAPACSGRMCGSDGCGGTCGTCSGSLVCNGAGACVTSCTPSCAGRTCGNDGCSGTCGSCGASQMCDASGHCVCSPNCVGRACGTDGCGGSCGTCSAGNVCNGSGACFSCSPGAVCSTGNACTIGAIDCSGGSPSCQVVGYASAGIACSGGTCNGAGSCSTCTPGGACSTGNPCSYGNYTCPGPTCSVSGYPTAGTPCPGGVCDGSGTCNPCSQGAACSTGNPCTTGTTACGSGSAVCNVSGNASAGASCPGGVCDGAGTCAPCVQGSGCTPSNDCVTGGQIDCSSGGPVCNGTGFVANGTLCYTGIYDGTRCDGAGHCVCGAGTGCTRCGVCHFSCTGTCP